MSERQICPNCNGTGNAASSCLAATDEYGCIQCGGAGYLCWQNDVIRIVVLIVFVVIIGSIFYWIGGPNQ